MGWEGERNRNYEKWEGERNGNYGKWEEMRIMDNGRERNK